MSRWVYINHLAIYSNSYIMDGNATNGIKPMRYPSLWTAVKFLAPLLATFLSTTTSLSYAAAHHPAATAYAPPKTALYNSHTGPFIEANIGPNWYYQGVITSFVNISESGLVGYAWFISGGYNFNPLWAIEAGFMQNYAKYKVFGDIYYVQGNTNIPYLTARISVPMGSRVNFLVKLGAMYASGIITDNLQHSLSSPNKMFPFVGLGFAIAINHALDFTINYQGAVYGIAGIGILGAGLAYHFA